MSDGGTDARVGAPGQLRPADAGGGREPGVEAGLIDLTGISPDSLDQLGRSALGVALRRVLDQAGEPADLHTGFQSGI